MPAVVRSGALSQNREYSCLPRSAIFIVLLYEDLLCPETLKGREAVTCATTVRLVLPLSSAFWQN